MEADQKTASAGNFAAHLKRARLTRGLSQRALSAKIGVPQSHISKIESGQVDVRFSSLVELARSVDLEVMLVPRSLVPVIETLTRPTNEASAKEKASRRNPDDPVSEMHKALQRVQKDATRLSRAFPMPELARLSETARSLNGMKLTAPQADQIGKSLKSITRNLDILRDALTAHPTMQDILESVDASAALRAMTKSTDMLRNVRNAVAHGANASATTPLPAYRLSDGDDDA